MAGNQRTATFASPPQTESRPNPTPHQASQEPESSTTIRPAASGAAKKKNRKKRKKSRKKSFAVSGEDEAEGLQSPVKDERNAARASFYRVQGAGLSHSSLDSEALLDHRYAVCNED